MKALGLDFTSAPSHRKPITSAVCALDRGKLEVKDFQVLPNFRDFEALLAQPGPWIAGVDFPFGQPRKLIENLAWPTQWEAYVSKIAGMAKATFEKILADYRRKRPSGDKQHLRTTDELAGSQSPMMLYGVPVGKMFFQGVPRLLKSGASIRPCRPVEDETRIIVEAYPALVARKWIKGWSYKSDTKSAQTPQQKQAREEIVSGLQSVQLKDHYGLTLTLNEENAERLVGDPTGDLLDSLLCAIQAAWAYEQRGSSSEPYGIPRECDPLEGWIVDPEQLVRRPAQDMLSQIYPIVRA